jgi:glycosyltransferase involved in cell wall biosynthesis
LYRDLPGSRPARECLDRADALVVLHPLAVDRLGVMNRDWAAKARVVLQSVPPIPPEARTKGAFDVCVVGHLRDEKDPLRVAEAARRLPEESRLRVLQAGGALTDRWRERATAEDATNPRYRWLGELSRGEAHRLIARSRLMVLPSRMEGGANVIGEAVVAGTAVIASRIEGSVGLLGADYPGLFDVGDTAGLAQLLRRAELDAAFLEQLAGRCRALARRFAPQVERSALARLLVDGELGRDGAREWSRGEARDD